MQNENNEDKNRDYEFWFSAIATRIRDMDIKRDKYNITYHVYAIANLLLLSTIIYLLVYIVYSS